MNHREKMILIVEDSPTQAAYLQGILDSEDYMTSIAHNGEDALVMIDETQPDLVLSDVIMPVMNGFELCERIKKDLRLSSIPVILLTSLNNPKDIIRGLEVGANNFIPKPFTKENLLMHIESNLRNQELHAPSKENLGMDIFFQGENYIINSDKRQIVNLLLSTYEQAVDKSNDLIKAHNELSRLNEDLERKTKQLEKLHEEKNYFLGMAAHDLKNPISSILSFTELLRETIDPNIDQERQDFLDIIEDSGNNMLRIINDLVDVTKMESETLIPKNEGFNISQFLRANVKRNQLLANKKGIVIKYNQSKTDIDFYADPNKLDQVLNNLITNAVKFSHPDTRIDVSLLKIGKEIRIYVEDQGLGIPNAEITELFKPFVKTSVKATHGESSTGLGLFIVKRIVDAHQGRITVSSKVGKGTKFCITLPELPVPIATQEVLDQEILFEWHNRTFLIVDDCDSNFLFLENALKRTGATLTRAKDGLDAIQKFKVDSNIDLILMDIQMPFLDGYETTREIKKMKPQLPIIAQTAYALSGEDEKCFAAGCDGYISNPVNPSELLSKINSFLCA